VGSCQNAKRDRRRQWGPVLRAPGPLLLITTAYCYFLTVTAQAQQFDNSTYPGHEKYMVTHVDQFGYPMLGVGLAQFINISITCRNGHKWNLVCLPDGSKCNENINEYIYGLTQWNVGQHCDSGRGNAD
jgi:hypothetical protein